MSNEEKETPAAKPPQFEQGAACVCGKWTIPFVVLKDIMFHSAAKPESMKLSIVVQCPLCKNDYTFVVDAQLQTTKSLVVPKGRG